METLNHRYSSLNILSCFTLTWFVTQRSVRLRGGNMDESLASGQTFAASLGQPFGQPLGQPFGQPFCQPYGQPSSEPSFGQAFGGQQFGEAPFAQAQIEQPGQPFFSLAPTFETILSHWPAAPVAEPAATMASMAPMVAPPQGEAAAVGWDTPTAAPARTVAQALMGARWAGLGVHMPPPPAPTQCRICRRMATPLAAAVPAAAAPMVAPVNLMRCARCEQVACISCSASCAACGASACRFCTTVRCCREPTLTVDS